MPGLPELAVSKYGSPMSLHNTQTGLPASWSKNSP